MPARSAVRNAITFPADVVVWLLSCLVHPYTTCRRCGGAGRNAGSIGRAYGRYPRCKGSPELLRVRGRLLHRGGRR